MELSLYTLAKSLSLGGGTPTITLIYISYSVGSLYIHVSLSSFLSFAVLVLFLLSKTKKTKNISVVSLWLSLWFFVFGLLNLLVSLLFENPKIFCFVCSCLSKIENPKIFCVLLWFCKVCCRVQRSVAAPLEFGYHIIQATREEQ